MGKTIISEGKTTNEAIEKGLKQLHVTKSMVDIKVLENDEKRSFFSILAPRIVKIEMTVKEEKKEIKKEVSRSETLTEITKRELVLTTEEQEKAKANIETFLTQILPKIDDKTQSEIISSDQGIRVSLKNANLGYLIGYRGETLYAFQTILSSIAGRNIEHKVRVILDIEGYKEKREKTLEELAEKVAKAVMRTKKSVTLEPMQAYERKIIHSKLQNYDKIETKSIGEEPRRRIVISFKSM